MPDSPLAALALLRQRQHAAAQAQVRAALEQVSLQRRALNQQKAALSRHRRRGTRQETKLIGVLQERLVGRREVIEFAQVRNLFGDMERTLGERQCDAERALSEAQAHHTDCLRKMKTTAKATEKLDIYLAEQRRMLARQAEKSAERAMEEDYECLRHPSRLRL